MKFISQRGTIRFFYVGIPNLTLRRLLVFAPFAQIVTHSRLSKNFIHYIRSPIILVDADDSKERLHLA